MGDLWWDIVLPVVAGAATACLYLWALWWSVRVLARGRSPVVTLLAGFLARTLVAAAIIVAATGGRLVAVAACLLSFWLTRQVVMYRIKTVWAESGGIVTDRQSVAPRIPGA